MTRSFGKISALALVALALSINVFAAVATPIELNRTHSAAGAFGCSVSGASVATPSVVTCAAAHGLVSGDQVQVTGIAGTTTDNGLFYASVLTSTTFALYSDSGLSQAVAGVGTYTSGGKVSIAKDISGLSGDFTLRVLVTSLSSSGTAVLCFQDSADGYVNDIVTLGCTDVSGTITASAPVTLTWRGYQLPNLRIGVTNARLRLYVQSITGSIVTSFFLDQ